GLVDVRRAPGPPGTCGHGHRRDRGRVDQLQHAGVGPAEGEQRVVQAGWGNEQWSLPPPTEKAITVKISMAMN
ncbi:MAG: hypothetical protein P8Y45_11510, partial [Exilibacterium sp.]